MAAPAVMRHVHLSPSCPLQGELARPDLWQECLLLEKLLYKNANQHRGAQHFQRLQEVRVRRRCRLLSPAKPQALLPPPCPKLRPAYLKWLQVRRLLVLLKAMQLDRRVGALHDALQAGKQRCASLRSAATASVPLAYGWVGACWQQLAIRAGGCSSWAAGCIAKVWLLPFHSAVCSAAS